MKHFNNGVLNTLQESPGRLSLHAHAGHTRMLREVAKIPKIFSSSRGVPLDLAVRYYLASGFKSMCLVISKGFPFNDVVNGPWEALYSPKMLFCAAHIKEAEASHSGATCCLARYVKPIQHSLNLDGIK